MTVRSRFVVVVYLGLFPGLQALCSGDGPAVALRHPVPGGVSARPHEPADIKSFIAQLGSDDFLLRREAESRLIAMGAEAFDLLQVAKQDPDLEIASQAEYLLHRVAINWVRPEDPKEVQELMAGYVEMPIVDRIELHEELSELKGNAGLGTLCRIAHFELDESQAKLAALAVLGQREQHLSQTEAIRARILAELGTSHRAATEWLRVYTDQLSDSKTISAKWLPLIDADISQLPGDDANLEWTVVSRLLQFHLDLGKALADAEVVFESLRRTVELATKKHEKESTSLAKVLLWTLQNEQWKALTHLENFYAGPIQENRILLYLVATARATQGNETEASEFADRALKLPTLELNERNTTASLVAELGYHNWAEKEWREVIAAAAITSAESMEARRSLAIWCLHDRNADQEAADLLAEVCDAVEADPQLKRTVLGDNDTRYLLSLLQTQREFLTACSLEARGDFTAQKEHLEKAYRLEPEDPDILIAMYRLPKSDEAYREKVANRIRRSVTNVEQLIEKFPGEPTWYNHYAWLVSNTTGDFERAVQYSHKSLELSPDTPSYLDTLGRCYYAAGDLKNAVKYQKQAVKKHPQVQVMRRQLEQFERELAAGASRQR